MAKKDQQGNWLDPKGRAVPEEYVPEMDKKRDALVERIIKKADKLAEQIAIAKLDIVQSIDSYLEELAKSKKTREDWKGNISLGNFADDLRIERRIDDAIGFDEKLQMVKSILDKWVAARLEGSDESLGKVVSQAFNMDKKGRINTAMLLKLLHLDIQDKEWKKAMAILKESIIVKNTKQYINFRRKAATDTGEEWQTICLNFNAATAPKEV